MECDKAYRPHNTDLHGTHTVGLRFSNNDGIMVCLAHLTAFYILNTLVVVHAVTSLKITYINQGYKCSTGNSVNFPASSGIFSPSFIVYIFLLCPPLLPCFIADGQTETELYAQPDKFIFSPYFCQTPSQNYNLLMPQQSAPQAVSLVGI